MVIISPEKQSNPQPQSSDSSENPSHSDPPKKTRDLPNLTECHSCGFKIDVCTGNNRLRTLYSEWRVVLLCNKCFSSVKSFQICSYCFSRTSSDSLRCNQCMHSVHKNCFFKYKNVAPWSYSCVGSEFSVCVDCWVPKHVEISRRRTMRSLRKIKSDGIVKKGRVDLENGSSRVLKSRKLIRSVTEKKIGVKKKVERGNNARDAATKKVKVARGGVELANREESTLKLATKIDPVKVVGCSYLALELRLKNSPRISKSRCLLNTSYLDAPKRWDFSVDSSGQTSNSRNASDSDSDDTHEPSVSIGSMDSDSSSDLNCPCMGRGGECNAEFGVQEIGKELLKEGEGSSSDRLMNFGGGDWESNRKQADPAFHREEQTDRFFLKYSRRKSDRYFLKYSRRRSDRYFLKYSRRKSDRYFYKYSRRNSLKPNLNS